MTWTLRGHCFQPRHLIPFHTNVIGSGKSPYILGSKDWPSKYISGEEFTIPRIVQDRVMPYVYQGQPKSPPRTSRRRLASKWWGACLTKAYDVTIQICRNSNAKIVDIKMPVLWCMVQNVVCIFKGHLWNFTQNFQPYTVFYGVLKK